MPTNHRRIAVVRDPELEGALRRARPLLGKDKPAATLVRELAIRGAEAIAVNSASERFRKLVEERGGRPAKGTLADFIAERGPLGEVDPDDPTPASDILRELRRDRLL